MVVPAQVAGDDGKEEVVGTPVFQPPRDLSVRPLGTRRGDGRQHDQVGGLGERGDQALPQGWTGRKRRLVAEDLQLAAAPPRLGQAFQLSLEGGGDGTVTMRVREERVVLGHGGRRHEGRPVTCFGRHPLIPQWPPPAAGPGAETPDLRASPGTGGGLARMARAGKSRAVSMTGSVRNRNTAAIGHSPYRAIREIVCVRPWPTAGGAHRATPRPDPAVVATVRSPAGIGGRIEASTPDRLSNRRDFTQPSM